jgi:hypothetical protein
MPRRSSVRTATTVGIDMGKNTLHMVGLDSLGAIVLRERVSRGRITSRLANLPPCLIGIEAKVGLSRRGLRVEMRRWRKGLASAFVIR